MSKIRKAIVAAIGTAVSATGVAMIDGQLAGAEFVTALGTGLVVGFAAWRVPNAARSGRRRHRSA